MPSAPGMSSAVERAPDEGENASDIDRNASLERRCSQELGLELGAGDDVHAASRPEHPIPDVIDLTGEGSDSDIAVDDALPDLNGESPPVNTSSLLPEGFCVAVGWRDAVGCYRARAVYHVSHEIETSASIEEIVSGNE